MINIMLPMAGKSLFFNDEQYPFPKPLIEFCGKPMIQHVIENLDSIKMPKRFIFIVESDDCNKFHFDSTLYLLTNSTCQVVRLRQETKGAACSCLFAIDHINNSKPLIIANSDQLFDVDLNPIIEEFMANSYDAATICFTSVHPRWSYVRVNDDNDIVEATEKRPISKKAIAGFYYFREGRFFVNAAMRSIKKNASVNGVFYIAPCINEMILSNLKVRHTVIANDTYHTFYSPQKIKEYEQRMLVLTTEKE